jgi:2-polyprenyl-3-methyl-5-hydroxy-6-metoxy-1,4-benzoquinol methylase
MCNQQFQIAHTNMTAPPEVGSAEAFAEQLVGIANQAGIAQMVSIGHRTGLFDCMAGGPAATSHELAAAAGLVERYVREWLAAMSVAGIVLFDPVAKNYRLPDEHAVFLTRSAAPDNLAVLMQYFAVLGAVEDDVVECFRQGGGVPYERFERFHEVMAEDSGQVVEALLVERVVPLVPGLVERLKAGIDVLDVGCGSGLAMLRLAHEFPNSRFTGLDLSSEAIGRANALAVERRLDNVNFEVCDAADLSEPGLYDLVTTFDAVHDQAQPALVLEAIREALRPGGVYLMQDIAGSSHLENNYDHPLAPLLYTISCMHCMTVSLAAGGEGLGTMWGEEKALEMLAEAGFGSVDVERLEGDIQNNYYVARPAPECSEKSHVAAAGGRS